MPPPIKQGKAKLPALHGKLMVDTVNGTVRVRAWPKPRGPNVPEQVRIQNDRFRDAQKYAPLVEPRLLNRLKDATKGTGLYPRDVLTKAMLNPPWTITEYNGNTVRPGRRKVYSIMFQGFRLQLDSNQNTNGADPFYPTWPLPVVDTAGFWDVSTPDRITIPDKVTAMIFMGGAMWSTVTGVDTTIQIVKVGTPNTLIAADQKLNSLGQCITSGPVVVSPGEVYALSLPTSSPKTASQFGTFFAGIIAGTDF